MDKIKLNKAIELDELISENKKGLELMEYWIKEGKNAQQISISFGQHLNPVILNLNIDSLLDYVKLVTKDELNKIQKEFDSK
jgi:hypothetical protein